MASHVVGRRYGRAAIVFVLVASLVTSASHAQQKIGSDFLVTNVRVFNGEHALPPTHVAVISGVIRAVGGDAAAWRSLPVIDGEGSTLIPGLIDAHVHVRDAGDLRQALRFGVTTVLDMATIAITPGDLSDIRNKANVATDMADVRTAGYPATSFRGHGTQFGAVIPRFSGMISARDFVAMRRADGSDYLKIMLNGVRSEQPRATNLDEAQVKALVEAADAAGMLTVAHVETLEDVNIALLAGVSGLAHVWRRGGASPETARRLAAQKVFVVPTLNVSDGFLPEGRASLLADSRFGGVLSNPIREHLSRTFTSPTPSPDGQRAIVDAQVAAVRGLYEAGVRLLVGSDSGGANIPTSHGISVHRELELLTRAGLKPSEILTAATANAAEAFGLADRGRILPGWRADMLLVRGDPTVDVLAVRDIVRVWKSGVEVDRGPGSQ